MHCQRGRMESPLSFFGVSSCFFFSSDAERAEAGFVVEKFWSERSKKRLKKHTPETTISLANIEKPQPPAPVASSWAATATYDALG